MNLIQKHGLAGLGAWLLVGGIGLSTPIATAQEPAGDAKLTAAEADLNRLETERAPFDPSIVSRTVAFYEDQVQKNPEGIIFHRELAGAYLARQRETGDIADAVRAEEAARKSLKLSTVNNHGAAIRLAQAMLAQHRFPEALNLAREVARYEPSAERMVIDILFEIGDYDAATKALEAISAQTEDMNLLSLRSRFADLQGHPDKSLALKREAAKITDGRPDIAAEPVAWYHTMVGHHLIDSGQLEEGEAACRKALTIFPNDYRAMTGMAEAATWRGDHAGALKWATDAIRISNQNPEALRLAGEACAGLGRKQEAEAQFQALRTLAHSFPRIYDRHWALFCLDNDQDLDEAMTLARQDLGLRHDIGAHDTLAWACFKKGLLDEADREMNLALAQGTQEAGMSYHAAQIAQARGDQARAQAMRAKVEALNPYFLKNVAKPAQPPTP